MSSKISPKKSHFFLAFAVAGLLSMSVGAGAASAAVCVPSVQVNGTCLDWTNKPIVTGQSASNTPASV